MKTSSNHLSRLWPKSKTNEQTSKQTLFPKRKKKSAACDQDSPLCVFKIIQKMNQEV